MRRSLLGPSALVAVCALALVAGCGSGSSDKKTGSSSGSSGASSTKPLTADQLKAALLVPADLPTGYTQDGQDDITPATQDGPCGGAVKVQPTAQIQRGFTAGEPASPKLVLLKLAQYSSAAQAKSVFDALKAKAAVCKADDNQGTHFTYTPLEVDKVGDEVLGIKIDSSGFAIGTEIVLTGAAIVSVGAGGVDADEALMASVTKRQVQKIDDAG